jgi:arylsulfatase A-like enzyme
MPMNRREFLGSIAANAALLRPGIRAAPGSRPNILHLMVDQMASFAIAGRSECRTPNINRLASQGILFERSYTPSAVCCPARAILCTGSFHWHNGVYNQVHSPPSVHRDMFPDVITYSMRLKEAGYRLGYVGKWHASYHRTPLDFGYDEIAAPNAYNPRLLQGIETNPDRVALPRADRLKAHHDRLFSWPGSEPFPGWGYFEGAEEDTHAFYTGESGIRMMKRFAAANKPWQIEIQWIEPHDAYMPLRRYLDRYDPAKISVPASFHDAFAGKPGLHRRESETWGAITEGDYRQGRAHYYAYCEEVDAQIGRVLDALEQTGQAENTLVTLCADHGDMVGAHRMWIKGWIPYEECYRIPMLMRWPARIKPGLVSSRLVQSHDLAFTYIDAAGAAPLRYADGRSLLPLAEDPNRSDWPDHILCAYYGGEYLYTQRIAITDRYKYVFNGFDIDECYDLHDDPQEMRNLVADPAHREVVDDMRARLYELMGQLGDSYGPSPNLPDVRQRSDRYCAPRYLPRGKRITGKS